MLDFQKVLTSQESLENLDELAVNNLAVKQGKQKSVLKREPSDVVDLSFSEMERIDKSPV